MKTALRQPCPARQRGVALIAILLVFTLIVILLGGAITRASLNIRKTTFHLQHSQALQYALGGEALARQLLYRDWEADQKDKGVDHRNESWHQEALYEPDNGRMSVVIRDLESRFNLNNLVDSDGKPEPHQAEIFNRLLQALALPTEHTSAIVDWLDPDTQPVATASEDSHYLGMQPPRRSADAPMVDPSELAAAGLFSAEELDKLLPHITALPQATTINPNTAAEYVLGSLHKELNPAQVISAREPDGFQSNSDFLQSDAMAGLTLAESDISVNSQYFQVQVIARFQDTDVYLRSVLHRSPESGTITTLYRSLLKPEGLATTLGTVSAATSTAGN
ncbi:MAG: type II secretion system minor pseudopilin GspK [Gammaproteobacteria bacterium]|nr:type II secretion system minor pseudopilin GspK [Gammaproteobacteria bacterium]